MYRDGEIDIHPEFQRFFRWSEEQKSRLIESILLGIPIPSIFVAQREDGIWDIIDGLQRISTIFQFMGILKDLDGNSMPNLILKPTAYLPALDSMTWDKISSENQLIIKRSKLDIKIMLRESDKDSKYELFQRLNTGGTELTEQETRNCIMIMYSPDFYRWIEGLSLDENFRHAIALTGASYDKRYDMELVSRFLVYRKISDINSISIGNLGEFITNRIISFIKDPSYDMKREETIFKDVFRRIRSELEDEAFSRYYPELDRFKGGFSVGAYEAIVYGMGNNYEEFEKSGFPSIKGKVKELWNEENFTRNIGGGYNASFRVARTLPEAKKVFKP